MGKFFTTEQWSEKRVFMEMNVEIVKYDQHIQLEFSRSRNSNIFLKCSGWIVYEYDSKEICLLFKHQSIKSSQFVRNKALIMKTTKYVISYHNTYRI